MFEIYWDTTIKTFFSYGSIIKFDKYTKNVKFSNSLLSPGGTIVQWNSGLSYFLGRSILQLPLLKRDKEYHLIPHIIVSPQDSLLIKISFYDRAGEIVGNIFIELNGNSFKYPEDAYSYKIELINIGVSELTFKKIEINSI